MLPCPKCRSKVTRIDVIDDREIIQSCVCGYNKVMFTTLKDGVQIEHMDMGEGSILLPRQGSKLSMCLGALASIGTGTAQQVASELRMRYDVDWDDYSVGSYLLHLRAKVLVERDQPKSGKKAYNCVWRLTEDARKLLELNA